MKVSGVDLARVKELALGKISENDTSEFIDVDSDELYSDDIEEENEE